MHIKIENAMEHTFMLSFLKKIIPMCLCFKNTFFVIPHYPKLETFHRFFI